MPTRFGRSEVPGSTPAPRPILASTQSVPSSLGAFQHSSRAAEPILASGCRRADPIQPCVLDIVFKLILYIIWKDARELLWPLSNRVECAKRLISSWLIFVGSSIFRIGKHLSVSVFLVRLEPPFCH